MYAQNSLEAFEASLPNILSNNMIPIQDSLKEEYNLQFVSPNITNKQKELIIETNKSFFKEFSKLYYKNIFLKNKLAKALDEKKKLNQLIMKNEQEISKSNKINGEKKKEEDDESMRKENRMNYYRKRKRKRRKKNEFICNYKCPFLNCNKSYPSKGSLNMHIKLKHQ